jgi:hypothetical protein
MPRTRKAAPIIDGPAYLGQKVEAKLAQDQASFAVGTDPATQPHDDGNGIAPAPDPAAQPDRKASTDLHLNNPEREYAINWPGVLSHQPLK